MNPTLSAVHISRPLTNISIAWKQNANNFVADKVFPVVPVSKQADKYWTYDRTFWYRSEMQKRAPATESAGIDYKLSTDSYFADVFALHKDISDQIRANEDSPLNGDRSAVELLTLQALLKKDIDFGTRYMTGGVWTFQYDGVASSPTAAGSLDPTNLSANDVLQWNDPASTPIEDVRRAKTAVMERTGYMPNVLTLQLRVYNALMDHPDILDRIKYGQTPGAAAQAGKDTLAKLFEVDEVVVAAAIQNTAAEGATEANSFIIGKHALLSYRPPNPGLEIPSAGYIFGWTGYLAGAVGAFQISKFRMEQIKSDRIEGEMAYDMKKVAGELGFFFNGIVA